MASSSPRHAVALAALLLARCAAESSLPPPAPSAVEPPLGYSNAAIPVTIRGDHFYARASQSVEVPGENRVDAGFRAWLGEHELEEVSWIDARTLTATVPPGLAAGPFPLVVEGPYGAGALAAAYTALTPPSPLLVVSIEPVRNPIAAGQIAELDVAVRNEGPGTVNAVQLKLKHVVDGVAKEPVPGDPQRQDLAVGEEIRHLYAYPSTAPGTLEFEGKASGLEASTGAGVATQKVRSQVQVLAQAVNGAPTPGRVAPLASP